MCTIIRKTSCLVLVALSMLFVNCSNEKGSDVADLPMTRSDQPLVEMTTHRNYNEALAIAKKSISMIENDEVTTRGDGHHRVIDEKNGVYTVNSSSNITRSGESNNDTLLYVFNFSDNEGFVVVSANRNTEDVLAITESGTYHPNTESDNPGFNEFMKMAKSYVQNAKDTLPKTRDSYWKVECDTLEYSRIEAKIPVTWGQGGIAGAYCSNNTAGCGPLAMAQIMSYYQHPSSFTYTFGNRDINYESVNWNQINQHIHTGSHPYPLCNGNSNLDKTIGRICRELGCKAHSSYNSNGTTGTSPGAIYDVLTYYGYTMPGFHSIPNNENSFMNYLVEDKLIIMAGNRQDDTGHFWLVDGGYHIKTHSVLYSSQNGINWVYYYDWITNQTYNHINWGWDGICNGLFLYDIFNANNGSEYDYGSSSYNHINEDVNFYRGLMYSLAYY